MDNIENLKRIILQNKILIIVLFFLAIVSSFIHYKNQQIKYTSSMMTSNGKYDAEYLEEMIKFSPIDTSLFDLPNNKLQEYSKILEDVKINCLVGSGRFIAINFVTVESKINLKDKIQESILDLLNHNKLVKSFSEKLLLPYQERLIYTKKELKQYKAVLDSLDISKNTKRYLKVEKRVSKLSKQKINLENKIAITGKYFLIIPIKDFSLVKKPFLMFLLLYFFLAVVVFVLISNKKV